ncbi:DUF2268 domain-containing protein [Filibacter tadaridae]|uniref:DUF2268 domain-containing protein n=1 Tax=Filibacter tadaridae TaxID=2483811 RepID=A0A3P5X3H1_9BACL|nr:DUF2268 domain-containing putative Zn-dependent protease [Filibacter tadaridae]VDC22639.1 hypothetical protein FILTAD_00819 [Filibacter tadaridae]
MPVINTQIVLERFFTASKEQIDKNPYAIQCEYICQPLLVSFPRISPEELQYELFNHGLFDPLEWMESKRVVEKMEKMNVWQIVEKEYRLLKDLWGGPEVSIYILPINTNGEMGEHAPVKNGVAYSGTLLLFLSDELSSEAIKTLFAHEYNHVCRLNYLGKAPAKILLMDSLLIEGLAEFAVQDLYGEEFSSPWVNLYSYKKMMKIWKRYFLPSLNLVGTDSHQPFLYGDTKKRLPKWIGYQIGYQIVATYQQRNGFTANNELYRKSSEEVIAGSDFALPKT